MNDAPLLRPVGEAAILVEFATQIDDAAHRRVVALDAAIIAQPPPGVIEAIPAFVSLLVRFDPLVTDVPVLMATLQRLAFQAGSASPPPREYVVPVCYEGPFAPDIAAVAERLETDTASVATLHTAGRYKVMMYGFAPGYAYLGGVPEALRLPRKAEPVRSRPVGSVMIAAGQCLVTTLPMPTGWWVIGRSPLRLLDPEAVQPFRFQPGDIVRFTAVSADEFDEFEQG